LAWFYGPQDADAGAEALLVTTNNDACFIDLVPLGFKANNNFAQDSTSGTAMPSEFLEISE